MNGLCSAHRRARPRLLLSVLVSAVSAPGGPRSQSWAQETCGTTSTTTLRVENLAGARALNTAVNCTDGGAVEAVWAGVVTLDAPISIGSGTFLSVTGEGSLAEVQGGSQVRLFDVSPSGGLSLTGLRLSGGAALSGGAVHATSATVTLDGCVFEGNDATAGDGGALWAEGVELTIVGGEFSGNSAAGNGGAVLAVDGAVVIQDGTLFEENRAILEGGALYCGGTDTSTGGAAASCSLSDAVFRSNNASLETDIVYPHVWLPSDELDGGGGAAFWFVDANITDSVFEANYAQLAGGAVFGGNSSRITIDGCTFQNNTTMGYGGAMAASSAWLGGNTLLAYNSANENGGGVFMWDSAGVVEFNDTVCSQNTAEAKGGCIFTDGKGVFNPGTTMDANLAGKGGCIYAFGRGDVSVLGGEFAGCRATGNGGFMFVSDGAVATITGGTVSNCVAQRRAGVAYCSGDSYDRGGSKLTIAGGTFRNNMALELGGAIAAWGTTTGGLTPTVVTITGGLFSNNTAKFYGGFIFLEELASFSCQGATISDHYAGDQGGAIYGRDATWVNSSCDLIGNGAPQGAAVYLTHTGGGANFVDHTITDKMGSGVSSMYAADSSIAARRVSFLSEVDRPDDAPNRAVRLEGEARLVAEGCVFGGWRGDTVIHNANPAAGSLVLDSCDFSKTSSTMVVVSPNSDAEIRNAFVCDATVENAATVNDSLVLVDRALGCDDPSACGPGQCVDSALGVLCECLVGGPCMHGGGALSVEVKTAPLSVTYSPDPVYFELNVSAGAEGTTAAIWNLTYEAEDLALQVVPSSGVLAAGSGVTVAVVGTPLREDVGGNLTSRFVARSVGSGTSDSTTGVELDVASAFYFCPAFQYAASPDGDGLDANVQCQQCVTITGSEGLDCGLPGATLAALPVRPGYWRSSPGSVTIHPCLHSAACGGGTQVSSSDDYCREGYCGPYCAVCKEGYGTGANYVCHSCTDARSRWLIFAGCLFILVTGLLLSLAVVFLAGGLDGVDTVHQSLSRTWSSSGRALGISRSGSSKGLGTSSSGSSRRALLLSRSARWRGVVRGDKLTTAASAEVPIAPSSNDTPEDETGGEAYNEASPRSGDLSDEDAPVRGTARCRRAVFAGGGVPLPQARAIKKKDESACVGLGQRVKRWASRVPMNKVKILVVVWQILTVFPGVSGVDYPATYSRFLSWIDVVNFDLGTILSASCLVGTVSLYDRLLLTTLAPLGLGLVLVCTYWVAKRRAGSGSGSSLARRAAWTRHMAAGLLLAFLVLTSTSTIAFQIFACDEEAVEGESFLRADYSLSCNSRTRTWYQIYAGVMILVYPVGIPVLYGYILWTNRESLNPRVRQAGAGATDPEAAPRKPKCGFSTMDGGAGKESPAELKERLRKRSQNPDLLPSMFLWKDFGGSLYYFEVIDCGRRILLTGALIFIAPNTATQTAVACMFAFASLLGFELLRPHLDPVDSWLYRLGCVVIFLSNFLALLIKVDAAGESNREVLGGILVAVNVLLFLAVVFATWLATHQAVVDTRDGAEALGVARAVLTFEKRAAASARFTRQQTETQTQTQRRQTQTSSALLTTPTAASGLRPGGGRGGVGGGGGGGGGGVPEGDGVVRAAAAVGPAAADGPSSGGRAETGAAVERGAFSESKDDEA